MGLAMQIQFCASMCSILHLIIGSYCTYMYIIIYLYNYGCIISYIYILHHHILSLHVFNLAFTLAAGFHDSADRMASISDVLWTVDSFVSQYYKLLESFETVTGHFASKSNESIHVWI